ncbi:glycosyltransferase [Ralstonia solanacearum]|uniref:glycosyltransferase n=1 Tax=Ralstonia solanacearum TaxID=305 RepID=UPI0009BBE8B7|nr:glycosyltransferase [Ralstonia solanacearum]MDB0542250.1 glycosyltransferase [Ralstonia solanacearum]MDB0552478.1 glycosyltransferase [Ralstonia solanacearum]MDB0557214.1 glycosyltransferase [Ralstonia solanacearum]
MLNQPSQPSPSEQPAAGLRLAYLVSRYPAVSHTFILREVSALRRLGAQIAVASVNPPDRASAQMSADERAEAAATYCLKDAGWRAALPAALYCLRRHPRGSLRALRASLGLGRGLRRLFGLFYLAEAAMVLRWMEDAGLRHLHVHFATAGAAVGMLVRKLAPVGLSLTVHGPDEFDDVSGQHLRAKLSHADLVVCISQFARSQLMRLSPQAGWHKLRVCRLGVAPSDTQPVGEARDRHSDTRLLCVGRLTPAKGQHILLTACAALRARGYRLSLTLIGDGEDRHALRDHARALNLTGCVHFAGARNQAEVRAALRTADAFVLPSLAEGIPVVLMEAMAAGVPCISTPVNGIPELISNGQDGLLAPPGDAHALATCIASLIDDPDLRRRLAQAGLLKVRERFDLERNTAALASLFATLPLAKAPSLDAAPASEPVAEVGHSRAAMLSSSREAV